jgi:hypothetical protein
MVESRFKIITLTSAFIALINFPLFNGITGLVKDSENLENRRMASRPEFNVKLLDPFPATYEHYYNDNFAFRSLLIKYYNLFNLLAYKKSPFPDKVIVGHNGWLYLGINDFHCYLGWNRFTPEELEAFRLELEYRRDCLEKQLGCKFYFMIAPGKANIYPEYIPYTFQRNSTKGWGEELIDYLNAKSDIRLVDLYPVFRSSKNNQVYYKLDNHWNSIGALHAVNEFCRLAGKDLPGVKPMPLKNFTIKKSSKKDGNSVQMIGFPSFFSDTEYQLIPKTPIKTKRIKNVGYPFIKKDSMPLTIVVRTKKDSLRPKLLISGDSFSNWFFPLVCEQFGTTINTFDNWEYKFNEDLVSFERPDAYLLIIHEPFLRSMLSHQARLSSQHEPIK